MWTTYKTNPVPQAHKKSTAAVAADVKKPILEGDGACGACDEVKVHIDLVWSAAVRSSTARKPQPWRTGERISHVMFIVEYEQGIQLNTG